VNVHAGRLTPAGFRPRAAGQSSTADRPSSVSQILHLLSETQPENAPLHFAADKGFPLLVLCAWNLWHELKFLPAAIVFANADVPRMHVRRMLI